MKKIIIFLFASFFVFSLHPFLGISWFSQDKKIKIAQYFRNRADLLAEKNPSHLVLHSALKDLPQADAINATNYHHVTDTIKPLLFISNTSVVDRLLCAMINIRFDGHQEWTYNPLRWIQNTTNIVYNCIKIPVLICKNIGQESLEITRDSINSLYWSDSVWMATGYFCANGMRHQFKNTKLSGLTTPLYYTLPLLALYMKKKFDYYAIMHKLFYDMHQKNQNIPVHNQIVEPIIHQALEENTLQDETVHLVEPERIPNNHRELQIKINEGIVKFAEDKKQKAEFKDTLSKIYQQRNIVYQRQNQQLQEQQLAKFKEKLSSILQQKIYKQQQEQANQQHDKALQVMVQQQDQIVQENNKLRDKNFVLRNQVDKLQNRQNEKAQSKEQLQLCYTPKWHEEQHNKVTTQPVKKERKLKNQKQEEPSILCSLLYSHSIKEENSQQIDTILKNNEHVQRQITIPGPKSFGKYDNDTRNQNTETNYQPIQKLENSTAIPVVALPGNFVHTALRNGMRAFQKLPK